MCMVVNFAICCVGPACLTACLAIVSTLLVCLVHDGGQRGCCMHACMMF